MLSSLTSQPCPLLVLQSRAYIPTINVLVPLCIYMCVCKVSQQQKNSPELLDILTLLSHSYHHKQSQKDEDKACERYGHYNERKQGIQVRKTDRSEKVLKKQCKAIYMD